jgi:rubrerythrin
MRGTKSLENLKEAFARGAQMNRRYLYFARKADIGGYVEIGGMFRDVAETETAHAFGHLDFLGNIGDPATGEPMGETTLNLRSAIGSETHDCAEVYPGYAQVARDEGFDELAEWVEMLARAEGSHTVRLQQALDGLS